MILNFWNLPYREEKYLAIKLAKNLPDFVNTKHLKLFEKLIREGNYWDFCDEISAYLIGGCLKKEPDIMWPVLDKWIVDENL